MRILDEYRNRPRKAHKVKKISGVATQSKENSMTESSNEECSFKDKWKLSNFYI